MTKRNKNLFWFVWKLLLEFLICIYHSITDVIMSDDLVSVDYEVFGNVQGVFFRQNTLTTASKQGCVGWVRNTHRGTVEGVVQGTKKQVEFMKHWLSNVGSPFSRIDKCNFTNDRKIQELEFVSFSVR